MAAKMEAGADAWQLGNDGVWAKREYHIGTQTLVETRREDFGEPPGEAVERTMYIRYMFRYEMEHLLTLCGFEVEALYGWFDQRPFDDASEEMVWVARKA